MAKPIRTNPGRTIIRLLLLSCWCFVCIIRLAILKLFRAKNIANSFLNFHRGCSLILGLQVKVSGDVSNYQPTLFTGNHISYLDIFIIGGYLPGYFIAKSEIAGWPIFGALSKLQNTLFFERRGVKAMHQIHRMRDHLNDNKNLILFAEGTSTVGTSVQNFKSSLFAAAEHTKTDVQIQPFTISYTHCANQPLDNKTRDRFAWYAEMPFLSHFLYALGMPKVNVELILHKPIQLTNYNSRKECAEYCQKTVATALEQTLKIKNEKRYAS